MPQLGRAVALGGNPQDFGDLERDLSDTTETVSPADDKSCRRGRGAVGPDLPVARERTGQSKRQVLETLVQIVVARQRCNEARAGDHR